MSLKSFFPLQKRPVSRKVSNVKAFMNSELDESLLMVAVSSTHVKNWHLYTVYRKIGNHYCDISHLLLKLSLQTHSLWVTHRKLQICASQSSKLSFPVKKKVTHLRGDLTFILFLCLQAWHPAESPSECSSSPAAPSTSPWAGRASRAGGRDPGLWRWGAGGPRRLLQRSAPHTHTHWSQSVPAHYFHSPHLPSGAQQWLPCLTPSPLSVSVCVASSSSLHPDRICSSVASAISVRRSVVVTPAFQGCLLVAREERQTSSLQRLRVLKRLIYIPACLRFLSDWCIFIIYHEEFIHIFDSVGEHLIFWSDLILRNKYNSY